MTAPPPEEDAQGNPLNAWRQAASALLSLPWELVHDGRGYLFQGAHAVRVRRRLPNREAQPRASAMLGGLGAGEGRVTGRGQGERLSG